MQVANEPREKKKISVQIVTHFPISTETSQHIKSSFYGNRSGTAWMCLKGAVLYCSATFPALNTLTTFRSV